MSKGKLTNKYSKRVVIRSYGMGRANPHLPQFTKHRKGKGQFARKKNG